MTVKELIKALERIEDEDRVVVFKDSDGGWTNITLRIPIDTKKDSSVYILASSNREK